LLSEKNLELHSDEFSGSQTALTEGGNGLSDSGDITDEQEYDGGITVDQRTVYKACYDLFSDFADCF